jgi:hypothetical protein
MFPLHRLVNSLACSPLMHACTVASFTSPVTHACTILHSLVTVRCYKAIFCQTVSYLWSVLHHASSRASHHSAARRLCSYLNAARSPTLELHATRDARTPELSAPHLRRCRALCRVSSRVQFSRTSSRHSAALPLMLASPPVCSATCPCRLLSRVVLSLILNEAFNGCRPLCFPFTSISNGCNHAITINGRTP